MRPATALGGAHQGSCREHYLPQDKSALRTGILLVLAAFPIYLYNDVHYAGGVPLGALLALRISFVAMCIVALRRLPGASDPRVLDRIVTQGLLFGVLLFVVTAHTRPVNPGGYLVNATGLAAFLYFILPGPLVVRAAAAIVLWLVALAVATNLGPTELEIHSLIPGALVHFLGTFHNLRETRHRRREFAIHQREKNTLNQLTKTSGELAVAHAQAVRSSQELEDRIRERTAELQVANAELTRALAAKDQFMAAMSHELRTPLTAVIATTELLAADFYGPLNRRQASAIEVIDSSSQDLLSIINDLLEWVRQDEQGEPIEFVEVDLAGAISSVLDTVGSLANRKRIELLFDPPERACRVTTEPGRLRQILLNLAGNALKFTPDGGMVVVTLGHDEMSQEVFVTIEDDGIGIARADLARIFEPFFQVERGLARRHEGTGLGLALASRFAETLRGRIEAESTLGAGSRFRLVLPTGNRGDQSAPLPAVHRGDR